MLSLLSLIIVPINVIASLVQRVQGVVIEV